MFPQKNHMVHADHHEHGLGIKLPKLFCIVANLGKNLLWQPIGQADFFIFTHRDLEFQIAFFCPGIGNPGHNPPVPLYGQRKFADVVDSQLVCLIRNTQIFFV